MICGGMPTRLATTNHHQNVVNMQDLGRWVFAKASCSTDKAWLLEVAIPWTNYIFFSSTRIIIIPNSGSGLRWFACFPLFSLPIVPNSCVDLWWFAVICGHLRWFAVVCLIVIPLAEWTGGVFTYRLRKSIQRDFSNI